MAKKNKQASKLIVPLPSTQTLKFSFEYYDLESDEYCISCWNKEQIRQSLLRLQEISSLSFNELRIGKRVYHFGEVNWADTAYPKGFPNEKLSALPAFHFALLGINGQKARVFGVYSTGTFYIVWFDLEHEVWPSFKKFT